MYDVEPRNLPDLLAQRPVIVFGKWRGEAKGKLILEGRYPPKSVIPVTVDPVRDPGVFRFEGALAAA